MILSCSCTYPYQDKRYGLKMRVHNYSTKHALFRCTVCGNTRGASSGTPEIIRAPAKKKK